MSADGHDRSAADPFATLALSEAATEAEVHAARRRLAKQVHPDRGGDVSAMQRINAAASAAIARIRAGGAGGPVSRTPEDDVSRVSTPTAGVIQDHPSFTIEALPAEAFEALSVVAVELGDVIDDDPPYRLEVRLNDPVSAWCVLDLVPDAGGSTVSLTIAALADSVSPPELRHPQQLLDVVRDRWVESLNRLEWARPGDPPRPS